MVPLLFAVGAESWGVPCAGLGVFKAGELLLKVLQVVGLFLHKGHKDLVAVGRRGVV